MDTRKLSDERLSQLGKYFELKDAVDELVRIVKSAPNDEYKQAESSLLMVQRIDLWCAGPTEVEAAVKHLSRLGQKFNELETDYPDFIEEFVPGVEEL